MRLKTVSGKSCLIAMLVLYVLLVVWYFTISAAEMLKYLIMIGGILLGTVVREAANKEWKTLRLIAVCVPVVAVAVVQAHSSYKLSQIRQRQQLNEARERARDVEAKLREELVPDPRDFIEAIQNADRGFLAKADGLAFRAALKTGQTENEIVRLQELQTSYQKAAVEFRNIVKPEYEKILSLNERSNENENEFKMRLAAVTIQVAELAARYGIAGLYNHAGALAMAAKQGERALAYYYQALVVERDHLPAYESLGYALWIVNLDAYGALKFASLGLKECMRLRMQIDGSKNAGVFRTYLYKIEANLKLQYAYFSALQFQNEEQAREYAGDLFRSKTDDPEYQDTWGYVLMRFANNAKEVEEAIALFRQAIENPKAERITKRLASAHLQQANNLLIRLKWS